MFSEAVSYPVMKDLVVNVKMCCGCSVLLRWCGQSSRDLTVCGLTGRSLGPSPPYFALGNHFHSSETYKRMSVTMVPEVGGGKKKEEREGWGNKTQQVNHRALNMFYFATGGN